MADLANEHPEDMHLRAAARTYIATKAALGTTFIPSASASYAQALRAYERVTGAAWSGNP